MATIKTSDHLGSEFKIKPEQDPLHSKEHMSQTLGCTPQLYWFGTDNLVRQWAFYDPCAGRLCLWTEQQ